MGLNSQRSQTKGMLAGGRLACEQVICANYKSVYRFVLCLCNNSSVAEDLTQETFTSAWQQIERFKGKASITTWLHRIAYNKFIDSRRRQAVEQKAKTAISTGDCPESDNQPAPKIIKDEELTMLREAIVALESDERAIVTLRYIEGFQYNQIAEILQKPVGTIKWQTHESLKKLRTILSGRV